MYNTIENKKVINENLYNANVQLVDKNRELNNDIKDLKKRINSAMEFILDKSVEYKPHFRKVDLNTKDCVKLMNILDGDYE